MNPSAAGMPALDAAKPDATPNPDRLPADAASPNAPPANATDAGSAPKQDAAPRAAGSGGQTPSPSAGSPAPPPNLSALRSSLPEHDASAVPCATWLRLEFTEAANAQSATDLTLDCGSTPIATDTAWVSDRVLAINPRAQLPEGKHCALSWPSADPAPNLQFDVAATCATAPVPYDRQAATSLSPFPDDYYLVADASTATGKRVQVDVPKVDAALAVLLTALIAPSRNLDGMSPLAPIVVELPAALDAASLPQSAAESLDAFASIGLFDISADSETRGQRVPFEALLRDAPDSGGSASHVLVVFPAAPLRPRGHYAFVLTNRARTMSGQALAPSAFMQAALSGMASTSEASRLASSLSSVMPALAALSPAIQRDDLALVLGISIRSVDKLPDDLLAIRQQLRAAQPPAYTIASSSADTEAGSDVAAIVSGNWRPLSFRNGDFLARDRSGRPVSNGTPRINFTLALPKTALSGAAPIVIYQHGQPGNAETEVLRAARRGLAKAGFAVLGFTDVVNREIIPSGDIVALNLQALLTLIAQQDLPDYLSLATHAEQLALLRLIPTLNKLDVLPLGAPDGRPDLDPEAALGYLGISQGSTHGLGLLAFAPEIHAAALTVGAGRFSATLVHQNAEQLYQGVSSVFAGLTHAQFYAGIALVQMAFDRQDSQNFAHFMYRNQLALGTAERASVLLTEGLGDSFVPYYATRSAAAQLGLPQLSPSAVRVPFLASASAPLTANIDAATSGAFFQYVPKDFAGATPTAGCVAGAETEGHYCSQTAEEALRQRVQFFLSSLHSGAPSIDVAPPN